MTADEIRNYSIVNHDISPERAAFYMIREIAAQLAEQNQILREAIKALNSPFGGLFRK